MGNYESRRDTEKAAIRDNAVHRDAYRSMGYVLYAKRMADLIKQLEANGECAVFGGPWFESLKK